MGEFTEPPSSCLALLRSLDFGGCVSDVFSVDLLFRLLSGMGNDDGCDLVVSSDGCDLVVSGDGCDLVVTGGCDLVVAGDGCGLVVAAGDGCGLVVAGGQCVTTTLSLAKGELTATVCF